MNSTNVQRWMLTTEFGPEALISVLSHTQGMEPMPFASKLVEGEKCEEVANEYEGKMAAVIEKSAKPLKKKYPEVVCNLGHDAEVLSQLRNVGTQLRDAIMDAKALDRILAVIPKGSILEVLSKEADRIPWELLYSPERGCFLGEHVVVGRPLAHIRAKSVPPVPLVERAVYRIPSVPVLVHLMLKGHAKWLVDAHPETLSGSHVLDRHESVDEFGSQSRPATIIVCHCSDRRRSNGDSEGPELVFSDTVKLNASELARLRIAEGAVVFLLACQIRDQSGRAKTIALDTASQMRAIVLGSMSLLAARDGLRLARLIAEFLREARSRGDTTVRMADLYEFVGNRSSMLRLVLRTYGPVCTEIKLENGNGSKAQAKNGKRRPRSAGRGSSN